MSDDEERGLLGKILYWFETPDPSSDHDDDIWHHDHLVNSGWVLLQNKVEWYESPQVITIYTEHKYIFNQNMDMDKPHEKFYYQNVDSDEFESIMLAEEELPSGWGDVRIRTDIETVSPPSGDNEFATVEYFVSVEVNYSLPNGITFLPRILARPLNRFFKRVFVSHVMEEAVEYDTEYARERMAEYFDYIRKYHGEEPVQTKTQREAYKPGNEGTFFQ
jgi:hypothetical protein